MIRGVSEILNYPEWLTLLRGWLDFISNEFYHMTTYKIGILLNFKCWNTMNYNMVSFLKNHFSKFVPILFLEQTSIKRYLDIRCGRPNYPVNNPLSIFRFRVSIPHPPLAAGVLLVSSKPIVEPCFQVRFRINFVVNFCLKFLVVCIQFFVFSDSMIVAIR